METTIVGTRRTISSEIFIFLSLFCYLYLVISNCTFIEHCFRNKRALDNSLRGGSRISSTISTNKMRSRIHYFILHKTIRLCLQWQCYRLKKNERLTAHSYNYARLWLIIKRRKRVAKCTLCDRSKRAFASREYRRTTDCSKKHRPAEYYGKLLTTSKSTVPLTTGGQII